MSFTLRPWTMDDIESLTKYANNFEVAKFLIDAFPHPYTIEDAKSFITLISNENPVHTFAIDVEGQAVGGIGIHPQADIHRKNAELGYWLAEPFWGQGIITEAIKRTTDFAFKTYDINRVFARPFGTNMGSQRVLEKVGFKLEAKFEKALFKNNEYIDELVYAFRL